MKPRVVVWNCLDASDQNFHRILKKYLQEFDPGIVVLVEMRITGNKVEFVINNIGMPYSHGGGSCRIF